MAMGRSHTIKKRRAVGGHHNCGAFRGPRLLVSREQEVLPPRTWEVWAMRTHVAMTVVGAL